MTEADQSVLNSSIHEYRDMNDDNNVLKSLCNLSVRSWRKQFIKFRCNIRNSAYPAHVESLWISIALVAGIHFSGKNSSYGLMKYLKGFKTLDDGTVASQLVACCVVGFIYWIIICGVMRYTLKLLLLYKGYMHESRTKGMSLKTKIWATLMTVLIKWNQPSLYSFQKSLPRLPVPTLSDTIFRFLQSIQPIVDETKYKVIARQAAEFESGIGKKLQRYLVLKSWWSPNYVSDWWEEYVYLRNRKSLLINSNVYVSDYFERKTRSQSARAANIIHLSFQMQERLERHDLKPILGQGIVPLCSWQYQRIFNTFREPGVKTDRIVHFNDSKHIAVFYRGIFYKLNVYHQGRLLKPIELQHQIEKILNAKTTTDCEQNLASLTTLNRTKWAETRLKYFSKGTNKESLHTIESAAFFLALDDEPFELSYDCSQERLDNQARKLLHGNGNNRWLDKSFSMVITSDGQFGLNIEHSWGDAPVIGHVFEEFMIDDFSSYDELGNIKGSSNLTQHSLPPPIRLVWDLSNSELVNTIDIAYRDALQMIEEVDHRIILHKAFGKGLIKTCNVSPDAFIQMALQLANYREFGKFTLTYEASMTRLFREGRTETVRSCSMDSSTWVKAMEESTLSKAEKIDLLHKACKRHQTAYLDAMCGRGVDRHIFCLYVVSQYFEMESQFLQEAISEPWRLSTSQTPMGQSSRIDYKKVPGFMNPGAGFGPVSYDGYSVSYIISGEDLISFHVSSNKSCPITNSSRFIDRIVQAMADIKALFE